MTLTSRFQHWAHARPEHPAVIALGDDGGERDRLTYAELDERSACFAAQLAAITGAGDRVLLGYSAATDFAVAFLGCLSAGVVAVPVEVPRPGEGSAAKLNAIIADCDAKLVVTPERSRSRMRLASCPVVTSDCWAQGGPALSRADQRSSELALLQYTSGSTRAPRGARVTQHALATNLEAIARIFKHDLDTRIVSWLPLFHDMGLIGALLEALYVGGTAIVMPPMAFLQKPARWLRAVSRYRATTSGAPNFAFDLCTTAIADDELVDLDLRSWSIAFNGAEPVRAPTLRDFASRFARCGFRPEAIKPCYGLAEATLVVSAFSADMDWRVSVCDRVSAGAVIDDCHLEIVDPVSRERVAPGSVGEIWVRGACVSSRYWASNVEEDAALCAFLASGEGPFARTGDLGSIEAGHLYVSGRLKDLVILRGRNHYPSDIESTCQSAHPALATGAGAAFVVTVDGEDAVVVAHEVSLSHRRNVAAAEIRAAVTRAVSAFDGVSLFDFVLVRPRSLPRTSSGKIMRYKCAELYRLSQLSVVSERSAMRLPQDNLGSRSDG